MTARLVVFLLIVACVAARTARADGDIRIRVSYKVVLNPANGARPSGVTDAAVLATIDGMNQLLETYGRGYRFVLGTPVIDVGGIGGFNRPSPSHYFGIDMLAVEGVREQMESDALADAGTYAWDERTVNIYINQGNGGGTCAFPTSQLLAIGAASISNAKLHLHEIGHYFDLCHTQGCSCGCCGPGPGTCNTVPGDDGMSDTLPDLACWGQDDISRNAFGVGYNSLAASVQQLVDDAFLNIMGYHASGCGQGAAVARLTEKQLDRWSDTATFTRTGVRDGRTLFVQPGSGGTQNGRSASPYHTVSSALSAAAGTDILMLRGGTYPENLTLSSPITLRAPRANTARIGQ